MSNYKRVLLTFKCQQTECPHFGACIELPTEIIGKKGPNRPTIVFVGQGGGETEAKEGRPFVGDAGQMLRSIIKYLIKDQGRELNVVFTNTVRCRPIDAKGKNRDPDQEEIDHCKIHLKNDLKKIKPDIIIPLGKSAATAFSLMNSKDTMRSKHGVITEKSGVYLMTTYHPSYLIRQHGKFNSSDKHTACVINDIINILDRTVS